MRSALGSALDLALGGQPIAYKARENLLLSLFKAGISRIEFTAAREVAIAGMAAALVGEKGVSGGK
jgi:hypothetical protein